MIDVPQLKVIDCEQRVVISPPYSVRYVALSYAWAPPSDVCLQGDIRKELRQLTIPLPLPLPKTIEDAMQITRSLGFRYLWVDKYCIDQNCSTEKHEQIRQMDLIYRGSELCIIAAAGDENTGLPGVDSNRRITQSVVSTRGVTLISTLPHPHHKIKGSWWMKRGWILQESILSRRRLVFTEDQVYFECNAMNCCEALQIPLDLLHTKKKDKFFSFMRARLFTGRDEGLDNQIFGLPFESFDERNKPWSYYIKKFLILATNYTSRKLSYDSDSLNAFLGIMSSPLLETYPVLLERRSTSQKTIRVSIMDMGRLGWNSQLDGSFTYEIMDLQSIVDDFQCQLEDGTMLQLHDYSPQFFSNHTFNKCALKFSAWVVNPDIISLYESNGSPSWQIGSFGWDLHISEFIASPEQFLAALRDGGLQCIFIAKGLYNSYFLITETHDGFARRIGTGEALFFHDGKYRRFADEVVFQSTKKKICLI